ncbi:MAG: PilZ domain-containing protein [Rhodospirillaceae bacterium]
MTNPAPGATAIPRAPQYAYKGAVTGRTAADQAFDAYIDNISETGAAIQLTNASVITDNALFVSMHIEGLGQFKGDVAGIYDGRFAVEFSGSEVDLDRVRDRLRSLDRKA